MPEDYQAIFDGLGIDTSNAGAPAGDGGDTGNQPTPPASNAGDSGQPTGQPATPTAPTGNEGQGEGAPQGGQPQAGEDDKQRSANEAFAAMRTENTKYKKFIQHMMKGANFNGDEAAFIDALTEASYQRQAQRQGNQVSPELLKRMDSLENQNRTLIDAQNRQLFTANLRNLQETLKLDENDLRDFVNLAVNEKIDLTIPGTNFVTLYQGLFFDKLKDRMIEEARQEWIEQNTKSSNAANPDGKSGKKDPTPTNVNTMAEFDSLLQSIPKDK